MAESFSDYSLDQLLLLAQTDQSDPASGLRFAQAAYRRTDAPEVRLLHPVARGKAAALAGLRSAQVGLDVSEIDSWFEGSFDALPLTGYPMRREHVATYINKGRAFGLLALRAAGLHEPDSSLAAKATLAFDAGEEVLVSLPSGDRYGVMLARHRATLEAVYGDPFVAAKIAWQGIDRARHAHDEGQSATQHQLFVKKQIQRHMAAGTLALSGVLDFAPPVHKLRRTVALRMLGG